MGHYSPPPFLFFFRSHLVQCYQKFQKVLGTLRRVSKYFESVLGNLKQFSVVSKISRKIQTIPRSLKWFLKYFNSSRSC